MSLWVQEAGLNMLAAFRGKNITPYGPIMIVSRRDYANTV